MDELLFEVAFSGQIHEGADLNQVKANIAKMFKADDATIAKLFSGKRIVIKKNLTAEAADKYSIAFTKAGAICDLDIMPEDSPPPAQATESATTKDSESTPAAKKEPSSGRRFGKVATISAVAVAVVVVLVAATPFVTGILAEQKYRDGMVLFDDFARQQSGAYAVKTRVDYSRGWLSSTVVNTITLEIPERAPVTFELHSDISHGPLLQNGPNSFGLASIETHMPLSTAQRADMAKIWKGNDNPVQIESHMDFAGNTRTDISVAGFTIDELGVYPEDKLVFEPLSTSITMSQQFTRAEAEMNWNGMKMSLEDLQVFIGKSSGNSQKQLSTDGLWLGDDEFSMSTLSFNVRELVADEYGEILFGGTIKKANITAHSEADDSNLVKGHTTMTVKETIIKNKVVASDMKLDLAIERLPAKALQAITEKISAHQKQAMQSGNPGQAPGFGLIQEEVSEILAAGPVLKITTLQANTEHGKVDVDLEATIQVDNPAALQNPMFLLFAIQAAGNASIPNRLIETTPAAAFVPGFIEQGYIKNEKGQLQTKMVFQQGQLTLNGKPLQP